MNYLIEQWCATLWISGHIVHPLGLCLKLLLTIFNFLFGNVHFKYMYICIMLNIWSFNLYTDYYFILGTLKKLGKMKSNIYRTNNKKGEKIFFLSVSRNRPMTSVYCRSLILSQYLIWQNDSYSSNLVHKTF